jgi:hypothetical protein
MPAKTRKTTRAKKAKTAKKVAVKKATKKAGAKTSPAKKTVKKHKQGKPKSAKTAKKPTAKKTAKKTVARKSRAAKTVNRRKPGKKTPAKQSAKKPASKRVTKTPAQKAAWRISPEISQSVFKIDTWKKGDLTIEYVNVHRSGWVLVDQLPDLGEYNPDEGINIFEEFEIDEHQLSDGSQETSIFPSELPAEERNRLLALSEAELEDEGWTLESVTRFKGPLVVEEV